jgi:Holliday junction resolvase
VRPLVHLIEQGWTVVRTADTSTKEQCIDVLATRTGRTLAVEVKGFPGRRYAGPRRAEEVKPTT